MACHLAVHQGVVNSEFFRLGKSASLQLRREWSELALRRVTGRVGKKIRYFKLKKKKKKIIEVDFSFFVYDFT